LRPLARSGTLHGVSRAFVKEDAQPEPVKWRRPLPAAGGGRLTLTLSGANRLKRELRQLEATVPLPPQSEGAQRLAEIEAILGQSDVVDVRTLAGSQVKFGATVVVRDIETERETTYQLVGEVEADLKLGRLSVGAPLARALMGRELGDLVVVQAPGGGREVELVELRYLEPEADEPESGSR
jgi:transcription elongation GreA/GreB family factor